MILGPLIHPPLLSALARAGHGAKVLLADGNYPHSTGAPASAERVWLNVAPGLLTVADVLGVLRQAIAIERAAVMVPEPDALPEHRPEVIPSHGWYREALPGSGSTSCRATSSTPRPPPATSRSSSPRVTRPSTPTCC